MNRQLLKKAFEDARKGKHVGGIGTIKEYDYEDFDQWYEKNVGENGFPDIDEEETQKEQ